MRRRGDPAAVGPRILVTGSSGLIGSVVAARAAEGAEVVGLDRAAGERTSIVGDITDAKLLPGAMRGCGAVIHVAGLHAPHVGRRSDAEFVETNVRGTEILLEAARRAGVRRFVFTSTTSVYGCTTRPGRAAAWVTEDLAPNPEDIYDATKLEAERLCRDAAGPGFGVAILRLSRCFPESPARLAFYRLHRGIDARDAAEGHWLAATRPLEGCRVFNLSAQSVFERADAPLLRDDPWGVIERRVPGLGGEFDRRGWKRPASIDRVYVIDRAKAELGFAPRFGVAEVLRPSRAGHAP